MTCSQRCECCCFGSCSSFLLGIYLPHHAPLPAVEERRTETRSKHGKHSVRNLYYPSLLGLPHQSNGDFYWTKHPQQLPVKFQPWCHLHFWQHFATCQWPICANLSMTAVYGSDRVNNKDKICFVSLDVHVRSRVLFTSKIPQILDST